jgi:lysophospholipase L1-like esterase
MTMGAGYIGCANGSANFFSGKIRACGAHPLWLPILPETSGGPSIWGIYNHLGFVPKKVICDGNSITAGQGGTPYPTQLSALLNNGFEAPVNLGVSSCETRDLYAHISAYVLGGNAYNANNSSLISDAGGTFLITWECTNDLYYQFVANSSVDPNVAATAAYARWIAYVTWLRQTYPFARIVTSTILKRGGAGAWSNPTNGEIARQALNALMLSNPGNGVAILDIAADAAFQDTSNVVYFADGTHPTTAGYAIIATYFAVYLNSQ